MIDFGDVIKQNVIEHNPNWPEIQNNNTWRLWIWKKNSLCNLIIHQPDIEKIYLYAKDRYKAKYQLLINKKETTGLKHLNDSKTFAKYSNDMDNFYIKILKNTIQIKNVKY